MKNNVKIIFSFALTVICYLSALALYSCKESGEGKDSDTSQNIEKKGLLQNYVEVPLDRAKNLSKEADERTKRMNEALEGK